jgi:hypothetical protein
VKELCEQIKEREFRLKFRGKYSLFWDYEEEKGKKYKCTKHIIKENKMLEFVIDLLLQEEISMVCEKVCLVIGILGGAGALLSILCLLPTCGLSCLCLIPSTIMMYGGELLSTVAPSWIEYICSIGM